VGHKITAIEDDAPNAEEVMYPEITESIKGTGKPRVSQMPGSPV
jgi:hypothetical protein